MHEPLHKRRAKLPALMDGSILRLSVELPGSAKRERFWDTHQFSQANYKRCVSWGELRSTRTTGVFRRANPCAANAKNVLSSIPHIAPWSSPADFVLSERVQQRGFAKPRSEPSLSELGDTSRVFSCLLCNFHVWLCSRSGAAPCNRSKRVSRFDANH